MRQAVAVSLAILLGSSLSAPAPAATVPGDERSTGFFVPRDLPSPAYAIRAKVDVAAGVLRGTETIGLSNPGSRPIRELVLSGSKVVLKGPVTVDGHPAEVTTADDDGEQQFLLKLPRAVGPGATVSLRCDFERELELPEDGAVATLSHWHPRLWWGVPAHASYDVQLEVPPDIAIGTSGRWNEETRSWRAPRVRNFGVLLGRGLKVEEAAAGPTRVRVLHSPTSDKWAATLLATAVDAVSFYRARFGMYPHDSLTIGPGMKPPAGGYPMATALVVVHGMEAYDQKPEAFWRWITAHEIGHQYWFEHVLPRDDPGDIGWLLIGLGVYADREYCRARSIEGSHPAMLRAYTEGVRQGLDTTADRTPDQIEALDWDFNNVVMHGKGFAIVSALATALGERTFDRVYRRALQEFAGRRLGTPEFRRLAEEESGEDLTWFFEQWVRSNRYLAYDVAGEECAPSTDGLECAVKVRKTGTLAMSVPVVATFEDGTTQSATTDRMQEVTELKFRSRAALKGVRIDPRGELAQVAPAPAITADSFRKALAQFPWTGGGERAKALYENALRLPPPPSPVKWFKMAMVLYDAKFYAEALDAFGRSGEAGDAEDKFVALAWQGHVMDVLGRRTEALEKYRAALALDVSPVMTHSQYGITLDRKWVEARLESPFLRR